MAGKLASEVHWIEILAKDTGPFFSHCPPMSQWWVQQRKSGLCCRFLGTSETKDNEGYSEHTPSSGVNLRALSFSYRLEGGVSDWLEGVTVCCPLQLTYWSPQPGDSIDPLPAPGHCRSHSLPQGRSSSLQTEAPGPGGAGTC